MYQDGYAAVYGLDTALSAEVTDGVTAGSRLFYYFVDARLPSVGDSSNFSVIPFVDFKPFTLQLGYARFDDGNALNKPEWMRDHLLHTVSDQTISYGFPGAEILFGQIRYALDAFWMHYSYVDYDYDFAASRGDGTVEHEVQFGYAFTKSFDVNLRLFDVSYDNVDNKDYQKVEALVRFKF